MQQCKHSATESNDKAARFDKKRQLYHLIHKCRQSRLRSNVSNKKSQLQQQLQRGHVVFIYTSGDGYRSNDVLQSDSEANVAPLIEASQASAKSKCRNPKDQRTLRW